MRSPDNQDGKKIVEAWSKPPKLLGRQGPAIRTKLTSGEINLAQAFEAARGNAYTIRIASVSGVPKMDPEGEPLAQPELTCTITAHAAGAPRH